MGSTLEKIRTGVVYTGLLMELRLYLTDLRSLTALIVRNNAAVMGEDDLAEIAAFNLRIDGYIAEVDRLDTEKSRLQAEVARDIDEVIRIRWSIGG